LEPRLAEWFASMKRGAAAKVAVVAAIAALIAGGAVRIYSYASPLSDGSTSADGASQPPPPCGYQDQNATFQPFGCWADYLGFLPAGYVLAPHCINCPTYPCPSGMNLSQCTTFKASCGDGFCDPNESCFTCPIDCGGPPSGQTCNAYAGRAGSPAGVCQVALNATSG
jgi:hypothetical protein